ncbi:MAG: hypothetical protein HN712_08825 [Gemmatimonadetes bacterium]|jgi:uncharacterized membrane protein|nr:hypothetical protein [Gemmatimonadota bacterium]MBT6149275.1 hypothetical protein [Gemmatimonadota bacterium]MBT7860404.1 hypothetical protein [Gemmatimonadota bacterium]
MDLPLHPMVVHLPIALAAMLPPVLIAILWRRRERPGPEREWRIAVLLSVVLAISASIAVNTGEEDEEIVEHTVSESALEIHEDRADAFLYLAWLVAGVAAVGLVQGSTGRIARFATAGCSIVLLVAAVRVGHAGAELVYRHGAAQAHLVDGAARLRPHAGEVNHHDDDDDD